MSEKRVMSGVELRVLDAEAGSGPRLVWYPAVYNQVSDDLGGFREVILPGAFTKTLREADVRALVNHDANFLLGRTKAGTLRLSEDERGLRAEVDVPATSWAQDLLVSVQRGDVQEGSFAFRSIRDVWTQDDAGGSLRKLGELALYDVSVVTFPAYPQTAGIDLRERLRANGIDLAELMGAVARVSWGEGERARGREGDLEIVGRAIEFLQAVAAAPGQEAHPAAESERVSVGEGDPLPTSPILTDGGGEVDWAQRGLDRRGYLMHMHRLLELEFQKYTLTE